MHVTLVLNVERVISTLLPFGVIRKCINRFEEIRMQTTIWQLMGLKELASKQGIIDAINQEVDVSESTNEAIETLKQNIKILTKEVKSLTEHARENRNILYTIIEERGIYMDEI